MNIDSKLIVFNGPRKTIGKIRPEGILARPCPPSPDRSLKCSHFAMPTSNSDAQRKNDI